LVCTSTESPCRGGIVEPGSEETRIQMTVVAKPEKGVEMFAGPKEGDDARVGRAWVIHEQLEGNVLKDFVWECAERRRLEYWGGHFEGER
jgi:hypothetical protein